MGLIGDAMSFGSQQRAQVNAKRNYKHRYRWAMDDMRKAGLNPILTAAAGIGGSISGSAGQSMSGPDLPDVNKTASNVMMAMRQKTELGKIKSATRLDDYSAQNQRESAVEHVMNTNRLEAEMDFTRTKQLNEQLLTPDLINNALVAKRWGESKSSAEWLSKNVGNLIPNFLLNFRKGGKGGPRGTEGAAANRTPVLRGAGRVPNTNPAPYVGPPGRAQRIHRRYDRTSGSQN